MPVLEAKVIRRGDESGDLVLIGRRGVVSDLDLLLFDVSIRAAVLRKLGSHRLISPTDHYRCVYNQAKMETKLH